MIQDQTESTGQQRPVPVVNRSLLLYRYPILTPIVLLAGSALLGIILIFSGHSFLALTTITMPIVSLYLASAIVLGISGILVSIISILEHIDRCGLQTAMFPRSKEHSYDCN